ncbi:hypothetical protein [Tenacibaculum piscium]|uniref:hypothetical protein n=1 Tax=Tenacibaculum piscium TaxID=1458515 RepID=UPI001F4588FE|nr:hypothetical protein [Tenacibaculum piscium]
MKNKNPYILLLIISTLISCNSNQKKTTNFITLDDNNQTSLPYLFTTKKGTLLLSWNKKINDSINQLNYSQLKKGNWEKSKEIIKGKNWFVNWADFPSISANNNTILSHFLKKSSKETYSYDIKLNVLSKEKKEWLVNLPLHDDTTKTEHGFVTMIPYNNHFFITWLDGRNTASINANKNNGHAGHQGTMTLRSAEVSSDGKITNRTLLDSKTCSCCQTTAAITKNGPIVLYRDRTDNEIRDISITRYVNGKWITPQPIYNDQWMIKGCPVNGPKVDALKNDVAVAWYTAVNDKPTVKVVFSQDGGANFSPPVLINNKETLGRVDIKLLDNKNALVSWIELLNDKSYLMAVKVNNSGYKSKAIIISEINSSRKSGFPQMEVVKDKVYFAWTSLHNKTPSIKTAYVLLSDF